MREEQAKQREAEVAKQSGPKTKSELLAELLEYLKPGENALKVGYVFIHLTVLLIGS